MLLAESSSFETCLWLLVRELYFSLKSCFVCVCGLRIITSNQFPMITKQNPGQGLLGHVCVILVLILYFWKVSMKWQTFQLLFFSLRNEQGCVEELSV